ncbi:MAG: CpsD/CapB family tyrosine-protein kinase [Syntrophomonadaceae bacterium]|nr:CpsD/CapB family tyrosine-protein kinase [Syntrophomonadaceae bacterium]MDD4550445.1 CpsD/CapB family tyrosine-protein kinase [Syntrophomonadaceae bacterium]
MFKKKKSKQEEYIVLSQANPKSAIAEAYRSLRTNLGFAGVDHPCRSIMVTSCSPQDGKSITMSNLAVVIAQAGHKVILVDCDLRKPVQHKHFHIDNHCGVTNCLLGQVTVEETAHTGLVENLTLLTSGPIPPNPAEILNSAKTRAFWPMLSEKYEYVLIDVPPVLAVTDASILATQVDGAILVVNSGVTRIDLAREARDQLLKANARIIGVVLNQVKMNSVGYQHYYYYYGDSESAK